MTMKRIGTSFLSIALCGVLALGNSTMSLAVSATENNLSVMQSSEDPPYTLSEKENRDYQQWLLENEEILPEPPNTSMNLLAVADSEIEYSGSCGTNVEYCFEDGTLTISVIETSSAGIMDDFVDEETIPWKSYRSEIETIIITDGVVNVGFNAFRFCTNLTTVSIPKSIKEISLYAFLCCESLTSVTTATEKIEQYAFAGCTSLNEVNLTNTIIMAYKAFGDCTSLESISIPSTIENLRLPFLGSTSLRAVEIPESNEYYCSVDGVIFNEGKTELVFYPPARNGESYILPETVVSIYQNAFSNNQNLTNIVFPEKCTNFGTDVLVNSKYIREWYLHETPYCYTDIDGNNDYLVVNGTLFDININPEFQMNTLDFTKQLYKDSDSCLITNVKLAIPSKFENITNVIADINTIIERTSLSSTEWYKSSDLNIIYNNADPSQATCKLLYCYRGNEPEIHAEECTHIGEYAFGVRDDEFPVMTLYLNAEVVVDRNSFVYAEIENIYINEEIVTIDYLNVSDMMESFCDSNGNEYYRFKKQYVNHPKVMLADAIINNKNYFNSLAKNYLSTILTDQLHIQDYKTGAQKVYKVYEWMTDLNNFTYGYSVQEDPNGDIVDPLTNTTYSKFYNFTYSGGAHLLTTHGVCLSNATVFDLITPLINAKSFYVRNGDKTIEGVKGNHRWNLVALEEESTVWYYIDITNHGFLLGQTNFGKGGELFIGYRDGDQEYGYIERLLPDAGYSVPPNQISENSFEPLITKSITISNCLSESYDVKLDYCEGLYSEISENGRVVSYNLFGETSFYENTGITVGENVVYTFENADSMSFSEDITGTYTVSEDYEISYSIQNTDGNISIQLWDDETDYVSLQDTANVISYYTVEDDGVITRYTESSQVALDDEFVLRFYDVNASLIATASQPVFSESYAHIADLEAAYKLSSGTSPTQSMITLETYQLGDVTTNGVVNGNDSVTLLKYLIGKYNFIQTGSTGNLLLGNGNITVNGDISANGTFTLNATDANINGQLSAATFVDGVTGNLNMNRPENDITITSDYVTAVFSEERMNQAFFNDDSLVTVDGNYENNDTNINLSEDYVVEGTAAMNGNVNINSNFKAEGNIVINGDVQNTNGGVIYSTNGDITLDSNNVNFNGFIYAPNGTVTIKASNVTIKGTIIAEELIIEGNCVNFNVAALDSAVGNGSGLGDMTLTEFQLMLGDMDLNGVYELLDVVAINRKIQGLAA